jgi:hypothetical protein
MARFISETTFTHCNIHFCEDIHITPFFQQADLSFCLTYVTKSPLLIFKDFGQVPHGIPCQS